MLKRLPLNLHPAEHLIPTLNRNRSPAAIAEGLPQTFTLAAWALVANENTMEVSSWQTPFTSAAGSTTR
jgi:hypothetical protein